MATAVKKATPIKKKAVAQKNTLQEKSYRLLKNQPISYLLKTGRGNDLLIWDEDTQTNRAIRHCPNEKSIFIDEQSKGAVVKPIEFTDGLLHTKPTDTMTQAFMDINPRNGITFAVIDEAKEAEELVDMEEVILDIKGAIRNKITEENGIEALRAVVAVLISDAGRAAKYSPSELKFAAYEEVNTNPNRFIDDQGNVTIFDDPDIQRRAITQTAFNSGVIQVSPDSRKIIWSDNKATICFIPTGKDYKEHFSSYLETDEGRQVAIEISKR